MSLTQRIVLCAALATFGGAALAQTTATPRADKRDAAQQQRIDAGVQSGTLTPHEANRMERQQKVSDKVQSNAKADGTVTPGERAKIHATQKRTSRDIHRQKHDAQSAN